jgi:cytochrome c oxidase cbb3-type subunit 1
MHQNETYNDNVVRLFLLASAVWGVIGMSIGVYIAAQLQWPSLNFGIPWLTFSRLRPDHTSGVIFAFGGSALMGTCYYIVQRTGHARLAFSRLASFTFWGWQTICVCAMISMLLGLTQSKEYAEPEWWIDIMIAVVWVSFGVIVAIGPTALGRTFPGLRVAIWRCVHNDQLSPLYGGFFAVSDWGD